MRQTLISAVYSKSLRLNSSQVVHVTTGKIINLISNDVHPCDEACTYFIFLLVGPVELVVALILISLEVGFFPAVVGLSTLMFLVPCQVSYDCRWLLCLCLFHGESYILLSHTIGICIISDFPFSRHGLPSE